MPAGTTLHYFTNPEMNVLNLPPPEMDQLCEQLTLWFQDKLTDEAYKTLIEKLTNYCKELTDYEGIIDHCDHNGPFNLQISYCVEGLVYDEDDWYHIRFTREEGFRIERCDRTL